MVEEVKDTLLAELPDEIMSVRKYKHLANLAREAGEFRTERYLRAIARDEYTHASWITEYLTEHYVDIPSEIMKEWSKVCENMI